MHPVAVMLLAVVLPQPTTLKASLDPTEEFCVDCCSLYCAAAPDVAVSHHLSPQGRVHYDAARLEDGLPGTAWVVQGGEGEWFEFVFRPGEFQVLEPRLGVDTLYLLNGYRKSPAHWREHARIRALELFIDGRSAAMITLLDDQQPQMLDLPPIPLHPLLTLRFVIRALYPGARFPETALSEVRLDGYGHH